MLRLVCAFDVRKPPKKVFLASRPNYHFDQIGGLTRSFVKM